MVATIGLPDQLRVSVPRWITFVQCADAFRYEVERSETQPFRVCWVEHLTGSETAKT